LWNKACSIVQSVFAPTGMYCLCIPAMTQEIPRVRASFTASTTQVK